MEDLSLGRIAALLPDCSEGPALGQNTDDDYEYNIHISLHKNTQVVTVF